VSTTSYPDAAGYGSGVDAVSYEPLTPVSYLDRAAAAHGDRIGVVDGTERWTYAELHDRSRRLAGALAERADGRPVAVLAPNTHLLLEANFGVPWAGVPLVAVNTRLSPGEVRYILEHSEAAVLVYDPDFDELVEAATKELPIRRIRAGAEYEDALATARPRASTPDDERSLLSVNYTSGTTGRPKGVMYHHRGAYLQALAMALHMGITSDSVYLWTLPMFHCNGWCFPWAVTVMGGVHLCLRKVEPAMIWRHLRESGVTHFCAAPTVLTMTVWDAASSPMTRPVRIATGGAPPTPVLLERLAALGLDITHLYGLTETYGPAGICEWRSEWNGLRVDQQARLKARQGVANAIGETIRVVDADGRDVPADATTMGEIAVRGNNVMLGYYKDDAATQTACPDGWFRTGDLGVCHSDGYVELRDRAKDIIISGGENISSVEIEQALNQHEAVLEVAVVAAPDEKWGEVPVAFVTLKDGASTSGDALIEHVRTRLARFKVPKRVVFGPLPKTSTGKGQKNVLRDRLRSPHS